LGVAAMPFDTGLGSVEALNAMPVQLVCDPNRCIDPRTGAYTQPTCRGGRCRPLGGIVGYTNPGPGSYGRRSRRGYDEDYEDYGPPRGRRYYERY
jgi:hypothetical protein